MATPRAKSAQPRGVRRAEPNPAAMAAAVKDFLRAAGLPLSDPNLQDTPQRVAEAWVNEFLDGYALTPEQALGEAFPAPPGSEGEMVVVTDLSFSSMCPLLLMPYEGIAHVS